MPLSESGGFGDLNDSPMGAAPSSQGQPSTQGAGSGPPAVAPPSALAPLSLPKAGGAMRGLSEKFAVNAVNGTASLSVLLPLSPGRGVFTPELHLAYDSGAGNGPFGIGWRLDLPAITRRTDLGLPQYRDAEESDIFVLAGSEDLVPVLDEAGTRLAIHRTLHGVDYEVLPYRPRIEGLYAQIERWTASATGISHWRTISNDNVTTLFGLDEGSTIASCQDPRQIYSYLICRRYDGRGNLAMYTYVAEDGDGVDRASAHEANRSEASRRQQRYLKSVRYGNVDPCFANWSPTSREPDPPDPVGWHFELVLDYGEHQPEAPVPGEQGSWPVRPDPFSNYRPGFEVRTYRRCQRALMFHHFADEPDVGRDCLVRALELRYSDAYSQPDPTAPVFTLLSSITEVGYRREGDGYRHKALPPLELEYSAVGLDPTIRGLDSDSATNLPEGLDTKRYRWIDLNSEGLPGVLESEGDSWRFKRNLSPLTGAPQADGTQPRSIAQLGPLESVCQLPSTYRSATVQLLDLAGSGSYDLVSLGGDMPGYFARGPRGGWEPFKPFPSLPNVNWSDPRIRFVDVTGNGRADLLVSEENVWLVYPSLGEEGYDPALRAQSPWDEELGPRVVFADGTETLHLADFTGDGLSDIVRVRNGEICYWPNLGYGRFGAKVTMDRAPRFADAERFDPSRVHLADIDGSGTSDLVYVGDEGVLVSFNQSGNSWSQTSRIAVFPSADELSTVQVIDLLGNGTACLVWSSPLPSQSHSPLRYVDLMSGVKPHLLIRSRNNLGAETKLYYAPSTRFFLEDRAAGIPWVTKLPFPVQVVERVETYDWIGRSRFVSRYAYHHGCYDGLEREFRGFGMVEEWDTEDHRANTSIPEVENWDAASWSPPVHTKTWFHTGAFVEATALSRQFAREYWLEPLPSGHEQAPERERMTLPEPAIDSRLPAEALREAHRALKGHMLRREVYAEDGSPRAAIPYTVSEQTYAVRCIQPLQGNRHAIFSTTTRESVVFQYDRVVDDPRVTHEVTLEVDEFDNQLRSMAIAYPRRDGHRGAEAGISSDFHSMLACDQARLHVLGTEHRYTAPAFSEDARRTPQPCETIAAELTGLCLPPSPWGVPRLFGFAHLDAYWVEVWNSAHDVPYELISSADVDGTPPRPGPSTRRMLEHVRTVFRRDDLNGLLALGRVEPLALPGDTFRLAFTPSLLQTVFGERVGAAELTEGGYVEVAGQEGWWLASDRVFYSSGEDDTPASELANARRHFFAARREVDAFGAVRRTDLDAYDLLAVRAVDAVGNVQGAVNDYRVLEPSEVIDPNENRAQVAFDCLGHVVGSAVMGKRDEQLGDSLDGFVADLDDATVAAHLAAPLEDPLAILQNASARMVYDLDAFLRTRDTPEPAAPVIYTLERETHVSELAPGQTTQFRHGFVYSDGFAREIQNKAQAEPGRLGDGRPRSEERWVGSGWTIYDNKGRPIRRYEPFFTATHEFEFSVRAGVSSVTLYDAVGRQVAALHPDDTWEKTIFGSWREEIWDRNDTTLIADPRADPDVGDLFRRLLGDAPGAFVSWYDRRIGGTFGDTPDDRAAAQDAARKAAAHAATPEVDHFEARGHTCLAVKDLGVAGRQPTRTVLDAEGAALATIDAHARRAIEYLVRERQADAETRYLSARDLAGRELFHNQMDGGERRMLPDVVGHPIRSWDAREYAVWVRYDPLRRPTHRYVSLDGGPTALASRTVYGEGMPDRNLCGEMFRHYDQSGVSGNERCDFKGNLVDRSRQLARSYREDPDWSPLGDETDPALLDAAAAPLLEPEDRFTAHALHDAFNRPTQVVTPHLHDTPANVVRASYNKAGLVDTVDVWEHVASIPAGLLDPASANLHAVTRSDYNAHGQRTLVVHGNGTAIERHYDPQTFRLTSLRSLRPRRFAAAQRVVQDLFYNYDPVGNITRVRDYADMHDVIFFRNKRVDPSCDFTVDAGYRLIRASGREHLGQTGGALSPPVQVTSDDAARMRLPQPGDGKAMGTYVESYEYDLVGNLLKMVHQVSSGAWTRAYAYDEPSAIDPAQTSNRLSATSLPGDPPDGPYRARYEYDAHANTTRMPHLSAMTWDEQNQLRSTARQVIGAGTPETTFYTYDAGGQRIRKVTDRQVRHGPGTRRKERIYLGAFELYREYGPDGKTVKLARETLFITAARRSIALLERRVGGQDRSPPRIVRYQYTNQLSTATLELDDSSAIISYEEYLPWGSTSYQAVRSKTDAPKRYRFTGKERDEESGFYYHGARYYAPWLGRWINPDPEGFVDGPNLFLYAHANPATVIDPTGTVGAVIGGGIVLTWEALTWLGAGAIVVGGTGILAADPKVREGVRERLQPHEFTSEPWPIPVPAPPVPIPVPPPPQAPPKPRPAPPTPIPLPVPVDPVPVPRPVPTPVPVPRPHSGPRKTPDQRPDRDRRPQKRPRPDTPTDPIPDTKRRRRTDPQLRYVTYRKRNPRTGKVYVGHSMGYGDPRAIVARRDRNHHMNLQGFGPARLDRWLDATRPFTGRHLDPAYQAIRGREQQLIDAYGGAISDHHGNANATRSGNPIRGVARANPRGRIYHDAASATFGQRAPYTGY